MPDHALFVLPTNGRLEACPTEGIIQNVKTRLTLTPEASYSSLSKAR